MGTPDYISYDESARNELAQLGLVCRDGFPITGLQTKDLKEAMQNYLLAHDPEDSTVVCLYGPAVEEKSQLIQPFEFPKSFDRSLRGVVKTRRWVFPRSLHCGSVLCSGASQNLPVFYENANSMWGNNIGHREMFLEVELYLEAGALVRVEVMGPTRDELRVKMLKDGVGVLPDDDRLVKREIKEWLDKSNEQRRWGYGE